MSKDDLFKKLEDNEKLLRQSNRSNLFKEVIIIAILAPLVVSFLLTYTADFSEKQNLAQAYKTEIDTLEPFLQHAKDDPSTYIIVNETENSGFLVVYEKVDSLYPDWGLYHSNPHLISKFNKNLSAQLYLFYYRIQRAEELRKIENSLNIKLRDMELNGGVSTPDYQEIFKRMPAFHQEMKENINLSYNSIPSIREGLNETINSKPFWII